MNTKALIVYASLTGNTEKAANFLALTLKTLDIDVDIKECQQVNASDFQNYDICIVATYTYGSEGDLPDEIYDFHEELGDLDLTGKVYGTLGTGEEDYGYFCKSADDFDEQFANTGATKGASVVKIEGEPDIEDKKKIAEFTSELVRKYDQGNQCGFCF